MCDGNVKSHPHSSVYSGNEAADFLFVAEILKAVDLFA
jgi:hypothetical protein